MKIDKNFSTSIHITLNNLIETKSRRDQVKFTHYQLAHALSMPRSVLTKLTHFDKSKRISNPKIDTLIKIVEFFRKDGFNITIDDLIGINNRSIDVQSQSFVPARILHAIALYSLSNAQQKMGSIEVYLPEKIKNVFALYSENDINSFFKSGSIFIVDCDIKPEHDKLIALKFDKSDNIKIRKYLKNKNKITLESLNHLEKTVVLSPAKSYEILGVIIQINVKT